MRGWVRAAGDLTGENLGAEGKTGAKPAKSRRRHGSHLRRPPRPRDPSVEPEAQHKIQQDAAERPQARQLPRFTRIPGETIYGALDLGTNNCRLLLARPVRTGFEVVDAFSRIVRLGEGVSGSGELSAAAIDRTIKALRVCSNKLKWWDVRRFRLIATEACRMAGNGDHFIDLVRSEIGLDLEIIDRQTEASLAAAGASPLICGEARSVVVFDIGGGSTEILWLNVQDGRYDIHDWTSLPAGVVTVAEKFGGQHVTVESFAAMRAHVGELAKPFADRLRNGSAVSAIPDHLLGTSGTVTTVCGIHQNLRRYDRARVDGSWMQGAEIAAVTNDLLSMTYEQRQTSPCVGPERADLVLAGCAILEEIRSLWPAERVRVADRGLREGILTSLMNEDGNYARPT
jgi:exopolyphosphatase/guanosine-5'-triphosphate,3'-diphosphate pyrophosphatase